MQELKLTRGKVALISDIDAIENVFKWTATPVKNGRWYAVRRKQINNKVRVIYLHRSILNPPNGYQVDHINGNGLDNRRENLRLVNQAQNNMNAGKRIGASSNYKGVGFHKKAGKWRAYIGKKHLGLFDKEIEAAKAYDLEAKNIYGSFAKLNFGGTNAG